MDTMRVLSIGIARELRIVLLYILNDIVLTALAQILLNIDARR